MTKAKNVATAFNCSFNDFCKLMGYSRQGVYYIFEKNCLYKKKKLPTAIESLTGESNRLYDEDIAQAEAKRQEREVFIDELRKKVE